MRVRETSYLARTRDGKHTVLRREKVGCANGGRFRPVFFCRMMALREEKVIYALGLIFAESSAGASRYPENVIMTPELVPALCAEASGAEQVEIQK